MKGKMMGEGAKSEKWDRDLTRESFGRALERYCTLLHVHCRAIAGL